LVWRRGTSRADIFAGVLEFWRQRTLRHVVVDTCLVVAGLRRQRCCFLYRVEAAKTTCISRPSRTANMHLEYIPFPSVRPSACGRHDTFFEKHGGASVGPSQRST
ncbi:unnamed protein product, partial [Hapterophycus canaliculatus]